MGFSFVNKTGETVCVCVCVVSHISSAINSKIFESYSAFNSSIQYFYQKIHGDHELESKSFNCWLHHIYVWMSNCIVMSIVIGSIKRWCVFEHFQQTWLNLHFMNSQIMRVAHRSMQTQSKLKNDLLHVGMGQMDFVRKRRIRMMCCILQI